MKRLFVLFLIVLIGCASPLVEQLKVDLKYGRWDDAIGHGKEAVAQEPGNALAHFYLAKAYIHSAKWNDATSELSTALRLDSTVVMAEVSKDPGFYCDAYYKTGRVLMDEENHEQAVELFLQASKMEPLNPTAYNYLARAYDALGDEEKMMANYSKALEIDSTNVDANYYLGLYHTNKGNYDLALDYMDRAEKLATGKLEKYKKELFGFFFHEPGPREKEEYLEKLISAEEPQRKEILTAALSEEENLDRALRIVEVIEDRIRRIGETASIKGLNYLNSGRETEAEEMIRSALVYSKDDADLYFYLVLALQRQDKYEESFPYLEKLIDLDPSDLRGWFQLGVSYFRTDKYDEAIEAFTKAIELKPDSPDGYINRGNVYAKKADLMKKQGKKKEERKLRKLATQDFEKAETLEKAGELE